MTWPEPPPLEDRPVETWGVERDPEPAKRPPWARVVWIVLTILIILSLILPWIAPYLTPRRLPEGEGLQALLEAAARF